MNCGRIAVIFPKAVSYFEYFLASLSTVAELYQLGQVPYEVAWRWQQQLVKERQVCPSCPDALMLLEHPPVYTLGTGADSRFLRFDPAKTAVSLYRVERGGEVTYHCPGQLVGYPILNLSRHRKDLHWYLRALEEVIIRTLDHYSLAGKRISGLTGVWLEGYKVASIGIKVSRWITMHGFALNVCPNIKGFEKIVPCGLVDKSVGSLAQFLPKVSFGEIREVLIVQFEEVFQLEFQSGSLPSDLECFTLQL